MKENKGGHARDLPARDIEKDDSLDWRWDDDEDLRRFLKGGLVAK